MNLVPKPPALPQLPAIDLPDVNLPNIDLPDVNLPDVELPDLNVEFPDVNLLNGGVNTDLGIFNVKIPGIPSIPGLGRRANIRRQPSGGAAAGGSFEKVLED